MSTQQYYYRGKLLLTGEYYVLDGATALAVPTKFGQRFTVRELAAEDRERTVWNIHYADGTTSKTIPITGNDWNSPVTRRGEEAVRTTLMRIFGAADRLGGDSQTSIENKQVDCYLEFPTDWGLGSSSTLISFLAELFGVDAYALLAGSFGGSGYDLACARAEGSILYRRGDRPDVVPLTWNPAWLEQTYFVHLNRKQNSREGIAAYRKVPPAPENIKEINRITRALTVPTLHLRAAAQLLERHEQLIAEALGLQQIKERFSDFPGTLKSLGAWGGDFVWVLSEEPAEKVRAYFNARGYGTFIPYHDMVL